MIDDSETNPFGTLTMLSDVLAIATLPSNTEGLLLQHPSDDLLRAIAQQLPEVRHILTDGNTHGVTDHGVAALRSMPRLESLDLEWSAITDAALQDLADFPALRWVDLGGIAGVSGTALNHLRSRRPDLEIEIH